jgi:hypothetical protein
VFSVVCTSLWRDITTSICLAPGKTFDDEEYGSLTADHADRGKRLI